LTLARPDSLGFLPTVGGAIIRYAYSQALAGIYSIFPRKYTGGKYREGGASGRLTKKTEIDFAIRCAATAHAPTTLTTTSMTKPE